MVVKGKGYLQTLFSCVEILLSFLKVKTSVLPAAEEAGTIWTDRFGFTKMTVDQVHPEAAPYRKYGCPLYDDLCKILKPIATEKYAFSPGMITPVTSSTSPGNNNKRKSSQPLGSDSGERISSQNTGVGSKTNQVATSRPNEKCINYSLQHYVRLVPIIVVGYHVTNHLRVV
ncbi:hypothetical protein SOVF_152620 [Spinacia oleracea]|nr:hypothetical protein SOVF_152620 [Spinacia oleracea]